MGRVTSDDVTPQTNVCLLALTAVPAFIPQGAKDLIRQMLTVNPDDRPSAGQLLEHPWITEQDETTMRSFKLTKTQTELKSFRARRKFRGAVRAIMIEKQMETMMHAHHPGGSTGLGALNHDVKGAPALDIFTDDTNDAAAEEPPPPVEAASEAGDAAPPAEEE